MCDPDFDIMTSPNEMLPDDMAEAFTGPSTSTEPQPRLGQPHKIWSITVFQTTEDQLRHILETNEHKFTRCAACIDEAPTTEGIHFHIAVVFHNAMRYGAVKEIFGETSHVEWRAQKDIQNIFNYVLGKGNHADFKKTIYEKNAVTTYKVKSGKKIEFYDEWRKNRSLNHYLHLIQDPKWIEFNTEYKHIVEEINLYKREVHERKFKRIIVWVYGKPGSGKSRMAHNLMQRWTNDYFPFDHAGEASASSTAGQVFGLQGDENMVLIDDLKVDKMQTQDVLKLLDQYPQPQDIKGSWAHYDPDLVIVTCVNPPDMLGNMWQGEKVVQLKRRLTYSIRVRPDEDINHPYRWYDFAGNLLGDMNMEQTVTTLLEEVKVQLQQFDPERVPQSHESQDEQTQVLPH